MSGEKAWGKATMLQQKISLVAIVVGAMKMIQYYLFGELNHFAVFF